MTTVLTSTDYASVERHVAESAPAAYVLREITAHAGVEYHTAWLDESTGHVWHAWTEPDGGVPPFPDPRWALDRETAAEALPWISETLCLVLDAIADPGGFYQDGRLDRADEDLDALDELYAVELTAVRQLGPSAPPDTRPLTPREVDMLIQRRIDQAKAEAARLSGLRAYHIREVFGSGRGAGTRAAGALGISGPTVSSILTADGRRRERIRKEAASARGEFTQADQ